MRLHSSLEFGALSGLEPTDPSLNRAHEYFRHIDPCVPSFILEEQAVHTYIYICQCCNRAAAAAEKIPFFSRFPSLVLFVLVYHRHRAEEGFLLQSLSYRGGNGERASFTARNRILYPGVAFSCIRKGTADQPGWKRSINSTIQFIYYTDTDTHIECH